MISATNTKIFRGFCPRLSSTTAYFKTERPSFWPSSLLCQHLWWPSTVYGWPKYTYILCHHLQWPLTLLGQHSWRLSTHFGRSPLPPAPALMSLNRHSSLSMISCLRNYTSDAWSRDDDKTKDLGWKWIYLTLITLICNSLQAFTIIHV